MQTSQRRVNRLKVSSRNEAILASNLPALQDAFNIASFPGVLPNRLLLVRKLDLGVMRPHSGAQGLSRSIDNRIQALHTRSVCVDDVDAPGHDVVWFSDPAQAVLRLVHLVSNNHPVKAWYWTVLFPEYKPEMSLEAVLILVSKDFIDSESRLWVMAAVIQQLCVQGQTDKIIASITQPLAQTLLYDSGISPRQGSSSINRRHSSSPTRPSVTESWQEVIELSINSWGRDDVRTLWMVVNALVIQNPAVVKAGQLLMQDVHTVLGQIDQKITTDSYAFSSISSDKYADLSSRSPSKEVRAVKGSHEPVNPPQSNKAHESGIENIRSNTLTMEKTNPDHQVAPNPDDQEEHRQALVASAEQKVKQENVFEQTGSVTAGIKANSGFAQQAFYDDLLFTRQSGFVFLISLLERLYINECLVLNPELASINLPARVVRWVARRMNIEGHHPLLQALPEPPDLDQEEIRQFVCPSFWVSLSNPSPEEQPVLYRFNIKGEPGQCCITDHLRKLVLYIGDNKPSALPEGIKQCQLLDLPGLHDYPRLSDVETTVQLLISRYLFRYAGIGLRSLINRDGPIAYTRTHLDVIYNFDQVDIRIRKAGLDINPGWVDWLGKVVQFHYDSGGRDDA